MRKFATKWYITLRV